MINARTIQFIKPPRSSESAGAVYTTARARTRGPSVLSSGLASALLARAVIAQSIATIQNSARGGFPPWEGGREIRRHISL